MAERVQQWVRLPTRWIHAGGLKSFKWAQGGGPNGIAALLVLLVIAHRADQVSGVALVTYDTFERATGLSRAKVSAGLKALEGAGLVEREPQGRSSYALRDFDPTQGWGKLPYRGLYGDSGQMPSFADFKLRQAAELNALKLYFLLVAARDNESNLAKISYDKITEYTGLDRAKIKPALTVLAVAGLVYTEHVRSTTRDNGIANSYRIAHLDPYTHRGTRGRSDEPLPIQDVGESPF